MICKYCGAEMRKDDIDFNFKGNMDIYWVCDECEVNCLEKIRYSKQKQVEWWFDSLDKFESHRNIEIIGNIHGKEDL